MRAGSPTQAHHTRYTHQGGGRGEGLGQQKHLVQRDSRQITVHCPKGQGEGEGAGGAEDLQHEMLPKSTIDGLHELFVTASHHESEERGVLFEPQKRTKKKNKKGEEKKKLVAQPRLALRRVQTRPSFRCVSMAEKVSGSAERRNAYRLRQTHAEAASSTLPPPFITSRRTAHLHERALQATVASTSRIGG